jgi:hypothetical protein
MSATADILGRDKALVGMVHVAALPGTPGHAQPVAAIVARAVEEARLLARSGFDAIIVENSNDLPFLRRQVGEEIIASMTMVAAAVRHAVEVPLGVQVLAGANRASVAIAHAVGASFVRVEGFVFASVADEGMLEDADAGPLLRYRRSIGAAAAPDSQSGSAPAGAGVRILVDVKKKHSSHAITADLDLGQMAKAAELCGADGVVVTGLTTGRPIKIDDLGIARVATTLPLIVGSGVTPESAADLFAYADALIVGSWYKHDGDWRRPPDPHRVKELVRAIRAARER